MKHYASKTTPHGINVGDLFSMSWGYDQTNVENFQVVRTSDSGVWVREIGANHVEGSGGFMCQSVTAAKDNFLDRSMWCGDGNSPCFRRVTFVYAGKPEQKPCFNFKGRYFAFPTTPTEKHYNSWYA